MELYFSLIPAAREDMMTKVKQSEHYNWHTEPSDNRAAVFSGCQAAQFILSTTPWKHSESYGLSDLDNMESTCATSIADNCNDNRKWPIFSLLMVSCSHAMTSISIEWRQLCNQLLVVRSTFKSVNVKRLNCFTIWGLCLSSSLLRVIWKDWYSF